MPYNEDDGIVWWSVEEWACPELMGNRRNYSKEMVRRYCRKGDLAALNAAAIRKRGKCWELRAKPLNDVELKTEQFIGGLKRLQILGLTYDSRIGTWHWSRHSSQNS
jgi:hypothetical protein